ncbi:MAG: M28 family peptidase [Saprospiraceae bacterium]|nr:M28 family peptidase [Saprospiraceae bacterium]
MSGEDSVFIAGSKTRISERHSEIGTNKAADFIKERFNELDINVFDQKYSATGRNIYAIQQGSAVPDSFYIICAHYDSVTDYCADDNASGTAAVLEAARLLSDSCFRYSIIYALWDEEELGLVGSFYFASQLENLNYKIKGVINLDMIGYDSNDDDVFDIHVNSDPATNRIKDELLRIIADYDLKLNPSVKNPGTNGSDHTPFWLKGIGAVLIIEGYFSGDFNKFYHSDKDRIDKFNFPYFYELSKLGISSLASLAKPCEESSAITEIPQELVFVYPNPTTGVFKLLKSSDMVSVVTVLDIYGNIVYRTDIKNEQVFELTDHPDGVYLIILEGKNSVAKRKLVKVK